MGEGDDNFAVNPPNALLSPFEDEYVNDVVVVLSDPAIDNGDLSYAVEVTDCELDPATAPASLLIDMIGRPLSAMSIAGVHRRGPQTRPETHALTSHLKTGRQGLRDGDGKLAGAFEGIGAAVIIGSGDRGLHPDSANRFRIAARTHAVYHHTYTEARDNGRITWRTP